MQVDVICCQRGTLNQAQVTFRTNRATRPLISTLILLAKKLLKLPPTGLHKFWNPAIPAWRTWSKLGEHGKHRKYGRYGRHQLDYLKHSIYGSKHSIYGLQQFICQRDDSIHCFMAFLARVRNHNMRLENMILRQLKIGERQASCFLLLSQTFPPQTICLWNFHHQPPPPCCQWSEYWVVLASRQLVHRGCNHGWARASSLLLEDSNRPQQPHPQHQQYLQMQELGFQMIKIYPIHRFLINLLTNILHLVWAIGMHQQLILLSLCEKRRGLRYLFPTRSRSRGRWAVS